MIRATLLLATLALLAWSFPTSAQTALPAELPAEYIRSYTSDITVHTDRSLTVTETITARSIGQRIEHGIYRDFPIRYINSKGLVREVGFTLLSATRDGMQEPSHTERRGADIRIYLGSADVLVPPGQHTYTITYTTDWQLGFFADHDELYWNVTGNGWEFQILEAHAYVHLPAAIPPDSVRVTAYTGGYGETGTDFTATTTDGTQVFSTTAPLGANEGLTVVVGWPKGYVSPPTAWENLESLIASNILLIAVVGAIPLLLLYYLVAWYRVGRDPKKRVVIVQYEPPQGLSPAALAYLTNMGTNDAAFSAAIIGMAIKGWCAIEDGGKDASSRYRLARKETGNQPLTDDERAVYDSLFADTGVLEVSQESVRLFQAAKKAQAVSLSTQFDKRYFKLHFSYLTAGMLLSLIPIALFHIEPASSFGGLITVYIGLALIMHVVFSRLMRQRTVLGQRLQEEIEGFKRFLSVTETERLKFHNPPGRTPELFEKYLPHAFALNIVDAWAGQFHDAFAELEAAGHAYVPAWYIGQYGSFDSFGSQLSSEFPSSLGRASMPPGTSSGSGGGGFSGGGGGGGGGGGW